MKTVTYKNGDQEITFNADWAATKTEKEFVDHESHHGLTLAQLKEAHKLCKEAVKAPVSELTQTT
jgi:hypothetical protein